MKRDVPTLADALIATGLDRNLAGGSGPDNAELRQQFLSVAGARKFVLDDAMSGFLFQLERGLEVRSGGIRKRFRAIENARLLSRLPHPLTFIEFNYHAYIAYAESAGIRVQRNPEVPPEEPLPKKMGWLIRQHPRLETVFVASVVMASKIHRGRAWMHPVSMAWTADSNPLPVRTVKLFSDEYDETLLVMMQGYKTRQAGWVWTFSESLSTRMIRNMNRWDRKPGLTACTLWALLATINDLPVQIEHVEPSRGYVTRGNYKKFLKHSVVHLTVPETRWRKLITKTAAMVRRRAHQVRGHWRDDWHKPLSADCEHVFNGQMVCERCHGRKVWIKEHQRGDASLGFVTHDYEVSKKLSTAGSTPG